MSSTQISLMKVYGFSSGFCHSELTIIFPLDFDAYQSIINHVITQAERFHATHFNC